MKYREISLMKDIVQKHLIDDNSNHKKEMADYFYASEAYLPHNPEESKCARQLGYKILKFEQDEPLVSLYPMYKIGDLLHTWIQKVFVDEGLAIQVEDCDIKYDDDGNNFWIRKDSNKIILKEPVEIHGRLDLKFKQKEIPGNYIADIKTINERAWKFLNQPKESHYAQIQIYMHQTIHANGILLYVNKSTGEMKEYLIYYDEEFVMKLLKDFKDLYDFIMHNGLPSRHYKPDDEIPWQCKYCPYTKTCLGLSRAEVHERRYHNYEPVDI